MVKEWVEIAMSITSSDVVVNLKMNELPELQYSLCAMYISYPRDEDISFSIGVMGKTSHYKIKCKHSDMTKLCFFSPQYRSLSKLDGDPYSFLINL